jgi:hypothetical protein
MFRYNKWGWGMHGHGLLLFNRLLAGVWPATGQLIVIPIELVRDFDSTCQL